jgi:SAM-dependent methyltransferase
MIDGALYVGKWFASRLYHSVRKAAANLAGWGRFFASWHRYDRLAAAAHGLRPELRYFSPSIGDDSGVVPIEPIYFYQDAWAFERIVQRRPLLHVDVGSHHKFVSFLSKIVPTVAVDIRPWNLPMSSVKFLEGSVLSLPYDNQSLESVSSLCVIEHIGLGRYGDPLDVDGTHKAFAELKRVVAPNGSLYISLPLDDESRIYFNSHRALAEKEVDELIAPFVIIDRAYIYGNDLLDQPRRGFGVGCYHLYLPK